MKKCFFVLSAVLICIQGLCMPSTTCAADPPLEYVLQGTCYVDTDANGTFDVTEQGIDNATVTLTRLLFGIIPVESQTTHTDPGGNYSFADLGFGFYAVHCDPPLKTESLSANPAIALLSFFQPNRTIDFGFSVTPAAYPVSVSISAEPGQITRGDSTVLSWNAMYAERVSIDNGIGEVAMSGSLTLSPSDNTTYTAIAERKGETAGASVTVAVLVPAPPPTSSSTSSVPPTTTTTTVSSGGGSGKPSSSTTSILPDPPSPVSGMIAAPGDAKIGLAWSNPDDSSWAGTLIVRSQDDYPFSPDEGDVVYDGIESDWVDEDLENNIEYYYTAFSYSAGPSYAAVDNGSRAAATPLAITDSSTSDWRNQPDPFADRLVTYESAVLVYDAEGEPYPYGRDALPDVVLGPPVSDQENGGGFHVLSLGAQSYSDNNTCDPCGGYIIVQFTDNIIVNGPGDDFTVFENPFIITAGHQNIGGAFMEPAVVSVSQDGDTFYQFPCDFVPPAIEDPTRDDLILHCTNPDNYPTGFAGIHPVHSIGLEPDPTDPAVSGGDSFDLDDLDGISLRWIQYVKIQSTGDNWMLDSDGDVIRHDPETYACAGTENSGFDLDAVSAIHY